MPGVILAILIKQCPFSAPLGTTGALLNYHLRTGVCNHHQQIHQWQWETSNSIQGTCPSEPPACHKGQHYWQVMFTSLSSRSSVLHCRQVQENNIQNITSGGSFDPTWCSGANVSPGWKTIDNWIWQAIYSNAFIYAELIQSFQSCLLKHWHPCVFCCHHLTHAQEQMWLGCTNKWCSNALI